jgi:hypothetical protein
MTFLIYALIFAWPVACLVALIFLFRPSRRWPVFGTRLRSFLMLVALFFGVPIFVAIAAPESMRVKPGEENKPVASAAPSPAPASKLAAPAEPQAPADHDPKRYLELSSVKTARTTSGTVLVSGDVFNGGERAARSARIRCYLSKDRQDAGVVSGVVRETVPAGEDVSFSLDMGPAKSAWNHEVCEIVSAQAARR